MAKVQQVSQQKIRIGFDLDGVILANPIRVFRSFISTSKRLHLLPRKELEFYQPKTALEKQLWLYLHKSSWRLANGFEVIQTLAHQGKIEAYIISGRFACLEPDTKRWLKKLQDSGAFREIYFNDHDEQPHLFKERMLKKLQLDYYVEDNYDLAKYLRQHQSKVQIWWLSNLLDSRLDFSQKFLSLAKVAEKLQSLVEK